MPNVGPYIYTTLAFLTLLGAPYIYEISSLRVKRNMMTVREGSEAIFFSFPTPCYIPPPLPSQEIIFKVIGNCEEKT